MNEKPASIPLARLVPALVSIVALAACGNTSMTIGENYQDDQGELREPKAPSPSSVAQNDSGTGQNDMGLGHDATGDPKSAVAPPSLSGRGELTATDSVDCYKITLANGQKVSALAIPDEDPSILNSIGMVDAYASITIWGPPESNFAGTMQSSEGAMFTPGWGTLGFGITFDTTVWPNADFSKTNAAVCFHSKDGRGPRYSAQIRYF